MLFALAHLQTVKLKYFFIAGVYVTVGIILLFVLVVVLTVVSIMIYKTRPRKRKTPIQLENLVRCQIGKHKPVIGGCVALIVSKPFVYPCLLQPNRGKQYYTVTPPHISTVLIRLTVNEPGTEEEAERLTSEGQKTNEDYSSDGSVKTECTSVDEEEEKGEESMSSYDRPQNLQVDMGDAEMVTGYTGC